MPSADPIPMNMLVRNVEAGNAFVLPFASPVASAFGRLSFEIASSISFLIFKFFISSRACCIALDALELDFLACV